MELPSEVTAWLARHPVLMGTLLVLAFIHRRLSVAVGNRERPVEGEKYYALWVVLGWISGAVWKDAEGSTKPILGRMPAGRITPEGGFRSGDTNPKISGEYARVDPKKPKGKTPKIPDTAMVIGFLFAFSSGCGASAYLREIKRAEKLQETSVEEQGKLTDAQLKLLWLSCNGWSERYAKGAQAVLEARAEVARGVVGAEVKLSAAQAAAHAVVGIFDAVCALAKDASVKLGKPAPAPTTPVPVQPMGTIQPAPVAPPVAPQPPPVAPPPTPAPPVQP